jgi:hypothetical protein
MNYETQYLQTAKPKKALKHDQNLKNACDYAFEIFIDNDMIKDSPPVKKDEEAVSRTKTNPRDSDKVRRGKEKQRY